MYRLLAASMSGVVGTWKSSVALWRCGAVAPSGLARVLNPTIIYSPILPFFSFSSLHTHACKQPLLAPLLPRSSRSIMATSTSSYEQLEDGIKHFLARHKDHPEVLANLARLLDSQPNILKVEALTPYDECKARLDLADDFQRRRRQECPEWQFTATKFSAFLLAPEYELKGRIIDGDDAKPLDQLLDSLGSATRYCMYTLFTCLYLGA